MLVFNTSCLFQNMLFSDMLNEILGGKQEHQFKCYFQTETVEQEGKIQQIPGRANEGEKWMKRYKRFSG